MKHGNWASLQYADLETHFTWPLVHAISVLKLIIYDHYHNGNGSKIVNHKISKVRAPKEKNRQRVRGAVKGTKAKGDEANKEDDCENEEGGHAYKESDEEDEVDPFSIEEKRSFRPPY